MFRGVRWGDYLGVAPFLLFAILFLIVPTLYLVAGAFVGYTAGPSISRSWGLEGSRSSRHRRQASRDSVRGARAEAVGATPSSAGQAERSGRVASYPAPNPPRSGSKLPPVQILD